MENRWYSNDGSQDKDLLKRIIPIGYVIISSLWFLFFVALGLWVLLKGGEQFIADACISFALSFAYPVIYALRVFRDSVYFYTHHVRIPVFNRLDIIWGNHLNADTPISKGVFRAINFSELIDVKISDTMKKNNCFH